MPNVYDVGGKKAVYWLHENVCVDKLLEAVRKEFPGFLPRDFKIPDKLRELELVISTSTIALVRKGTISSPTEYLPPRYDFGEWG